MYARIDPNAPTNNNMCSFLIGGKGSGQAHTWSQPFASDSNPDNLASGIGFYRGSLNLGSGTVVGDTGAWLYNSILSGSGVLQSLLLANRGVNTFFYAINDQGPFNVSRGTPIGSGESALIETSRVRSVWAITNTGQTTTVSMSAVRAYNPNTN